MGKIFTPDLWYSKRSEAVRVAQQLLECSHKLDTRRMCLTYWALGDLKILGFGLDLRKNQQL